MKDMNIPTCGAFDKVWEAARNIPMTVTVTPAEIVPVTPSEKWFTDEVSVTLTYDDNSNK